MTRNRKSNVLALLVAVCICAWTSTATPSHAQSARSAKYERIDGRVEVKNFTSAVDAIGGTAGVCSIDNIRLGGLPDDAWIGPWCNSNGSYATCWYVTGSELPGPNPSYLLQLPWTRRNGPSYRGDGH